MLSSTTRPHHSRLTLEDWNISSDQGRALRQTFDPRRRNSAKSKALLIGIEYANPTNRQAQVDLLSGIHNDVRRLKDHLVNNLKYPAEHVKILVDGYNDETMRPTNILREIDELVSDVKAGDRLVLCFGGHCYQLVNRDFT